MVERSDNIRYYLSDGVNDPVLVEDAQNFRDLGGDTYKLEEGGHFVTERNATVTLYETGYNYLLGQLLSNGVNADVRFITHQKDDMAFEQEWKETSNLSVNMATLSFKEQADNPSVEVELVQDNLLQRIKARWNDDFDVLAEDVPELPYVRIKHRQRQILKRSRFVAGEQEVTVERDSGDTAKAVPLQIDYTSESQQVNSVFNTFANSSGGGYADLTTVGNTFIWNVPRDIVYTLDGTVRINVTQPSFSGSYFRMDLVRYTGGEDTNYDSIIQSMGQIDPSVGGGTQISYTFNNYELTVRQGESIGIMVLTDAGDGPVNLDLKFRTDESTDLRLQTETPFPITYSKAVKPEDMFKHLSRIALNDQNLDFVTSVFGPGQRHEGKLLVHGTWLRNMPQVINQGDGDERRIQAELSLEELFGAYSILEPLRYDAKRINNKNTFIIGSEKDILQNFTAIRLGETTDKFRLIEPNEKERDVIGENYWGSVNLGSETSGSNYGQVNNLFSVCGHAKWGTINDTIEEAYEFVTDFRTGAEDVELQRQFPYSDNPDLDGEYDNDWFLIDCELVGSDYVPKDWTHYYDTLPDTYSPETNYNWCFIPVELLRGHGFRINEALLEKPEESLRTPVGNCNLSFSVKRAGEAPIRCNEPFPHSFLERPRVRLMNQNFTMPITQEIVDMLRGQTNGIDNKFGLIEHLWRGRVVKSRLIEAEAEKNASFTLIQART